MPTSPLYLVLDTIPGWHGHNTNYYVLCWITRVGIVHSHLPPPSPHLIAHTLHRKWYLLKFPKLYQTNVMFKCPTTLRFSPVQSIRPIDIICMFKQPPTDPCESNYILYIIMFCVAPATQLLCKYTKNYQNSYDSSWRHRIW